MPRRYSIAVRAKDIRCGKVERVIYYTLRLLGHKMRLNR